MVAAIILPNLITNIQDRQFRTAWKKAFAEVSNAYRLSLESPIDYTFAEGYKSSEYAEKDTYPIYYKLFLNLNPSDYCVTGLTTASSCEQMYRKKIDKYYQFTPLASLLNNDVTERAYSTNIAGGFAILRDGIHLFGHAPFWSYPNLMVDVNGAAKPNVVGRDIFVILIRKGQVIAGGAPGNELKGCSKDISSKANHDIENLSGSGCGYKYLYEK